MNSVSVVIPCYRYGHFLEDAVSSALHGQEGVDVRVLVIDDCSADGSAEVARRIAAGDDRVDLVVHTKNRGHIATYNEGLLEWADGDYTVLLSADDRLAPGALPRAAGLLDAHPNVGFAYGNAVWFSDGSPLPSPRTRGRGWTVWPGRVWIENRCRQGQSGLSSPEVLVRTNLQRRVGGYDSRMPHLADTHMWLRLAAHGDVGYLRGVDQAYYRRHAGNMSTAFTPLLTLQQYQLAYDAALESCRHRLTDVDELSSLVHRRLASEALLAAARAYDGGTASEAPVEELIAFATGCWPGAQRLPVYRTLRLRQRLGPSLAPRLRHLGLPAAGARKAEAWWMRRAEHSIDEAIRKWWLRRRAISGEAALRRAPAEALGTKS